MGVDALRFDVDAGDAQYNPERNYDTPSFSREAGMTSVRGGAVQSRRAQPTPQKQLEDMLVYLNTKGCIVPSFDSSNQVPQSQLMACQDTRWVFSETEFNDKPTILGREFLLKVDITLCWIRSLIENTYGHFPPPSLPVLHFMTKMPF